MSPDSNGGFASVRASVSPLPGGDIDAIELVVRGDGHRYKLNLRTDQTVEGVNHQAHFQPPAGQWSIVDVPVTAFVPTFRGRVVPAPPLAPERVSQVGWMVADRQFGPFLLCIRGIACVESGA
mgnify:CR=1 FL=1